MAEPVVMSANRVATPIEPPAGKRPNFRRYAEPISVVDPGSTPTARIRDEPTVGTLPGEVGGVTATYPRYEDPRALQTVTNIEPVEGEIAIDTEQHGSGQTPVQATGGIPLQIHMMIDQIACIHGLPGQPQTQGVDHVAMSSGVSVFFHAFEAAELPITLTS